MACNPCNTKKKKDVTCCGSTTTETTTKITKTGGALCEMPTGAVQYVGARYVPAFADPIEWTADRPYEHLMMVQHEGGTWITRQAVPVGIELDNEEYWVYLTDWNAQIEQYRQEVINYVDEVEQFDARITENAENIVKNSGISYVGNYGAVEKDCNVDWQAIIDEIAQVSNTIDFGNGQWYFSSGVDIPAGVHTITGNGAILYACAPIDYFFDVSNLRIVTEEKQKRFATISGIRFNGYNLYTSGIDGAYAKRGIVADKVTNAGNTCQIVNCSFSNFSEYGIHIQGLGLTILSCFFANQYNRNAGCAIYGGTDSFVSDCKFFYWETAIMLGNGSHISGCYFFTQQQTTPTTAISSNSASLTFFTVTNCRFDCITRCFTDCSGVFMANSFYWNGKDYDAANLRASLFYWTYNHTKRVNFSYNTLNFSRSDNSLIVAEVWSFDCDPSVTAPRINYESHDCMSDKLFISAFSDDMSQNVRDMLSRVKITCGFSDKWVGLYDGQGNNRRFTRFSAMDIENVNLTPAMLIRSNINSQETRMFGIENDSTLSMIAYSRTRYSQYELLYPDVDYPSFFYVSNNPLSVERVEISSRLPWNMNWLVEVNPNTNNMNSRTGKFVAVTTEPPIVDPS